MKNILKKNQKKAFSLTELAIVVIIISVFISGIIGVAKSISNNAKITITKNRMNEIYKAMGSYVASNGALPCPAPITYIKDSANYGNNSANNYNECHNTATDLYMTGVYGVGSDVNALVYGAIPVQNLKLSSEMAEDGFGTKFSYFVYAKFTGFEGGPRTGSGDIFSRAAEGSVLTIKENYGSFVKDITSDAIFVIVSHGANKKGGFDASSSQQNIRSVDDDEKDNDFFAPSGVPAFNSIFFSLSDKSDIFDDIVFFKTRKDIITDFDLLSLRMCLSNGTNFNDVYVDNSTTLATWPDTPYGQVAVSTLPCDRIAPNYNGTVVYPTKKCGLFGVWQVGATESCQ